MRANRELLTIAVVVHEDLLGLRRLLRSLKRSFARGPSYPVLIIDNGSVQEPITDEIQSEFPELTLRILRRSRNSLCEARQNALEEATSEWVAFIDADCRVLPNWSRKVFEEFKRLTDVPDLAAWGAPALNRGQSLEAEVSRWLGQAFPGHHAVTEAQTTFHLPTSHLFLHRKRALQAGGFGSNFHRAGEDMILSYKLNQLNYKTLLLPEPRIFHAQKPGLRRFFSRLIRYGGVHGSLVWLYPKHLFGRRFLPLLILIFVCGLFVYRPVIGATLLVSSLFLWLYRRPISGGKRRNILAWLIVAGAFLSYSMGTIRGLALKRA